MKLTQPIVASCRRQFPALHRELAGQPIAYLDGPAGTQVPRRVIDAVSEYYSMCNANHGGLFATSRESDELLWSSHQAMADMFGTEDPSTVSFGPNMTTLTFALSRALAREWGPGDEIIVTQLDHDANFTPWVMAANDAGATVRMVRVRTADCTLDLDELRAFLSPRTRMVAVGCASNAVGTLNPVKEICQWAREAGALSFLDAVHYAPHVLMDVNALGCDFLACSAYKFFGPHIGVQWGRRELLERLEPYKLRPAPNDLPGKWMTGTQVHECIAGVRAAVEYLADVGRAVKQDPKLERRRALSAAYHAIGDYESELTLQLLAGLRELPRIQVWGITDPARIQERTATVAITHSDQSARDVAQYLGQRGIFAWHGNYYALNLSEALGREPDGMVRLGLVHYNTPAEVERVLQALAQI